MNHLTQLTYDSRLGDLPLQDFQVSPTTLGQVVANHFKQHPGLSGVIVADDKRLLGMISRRRFHEHMSQPYSQEIFLKRRIQIFLEISEQKVRHLQLPHTEKVGTAVRKAVNRPLEAVYEPLIIEFKDETPPKFTVYFLLSFQTLIFAQSKILTDVNGELREQSAKARHYLIQLKQEQQKVQGYTQLLEEQKKIIESRNQILENQQIELVNKVQEIAQLNQIVMRIGQLISLEGKKAFQATFAGVNAICSNINQVVDIGRLLSEELETIGSTSVLVEKVSHQVRHLAVQAAIVANHAGKELSDFSHITTEIGRLVSQTSEAGRQMNRVSTRFMLKMQELTSSAQAGTTVARSLVQKNEQAEKALAELEALIQQQYPGKGLMTQDSSKTAETINTSTYSEEATEEALEGTQALIQKIALAEATLSEWRERTRPKDSEQLIQKIQRALKQHKKSLVQ